MTENVSGSRGGGILRTFSRETGKFETRFRFDRAGIKGAVIDCFIVDSSGSQYICTSKHGLYKVDKDGHIVFHFMMGETNSLFEDSKGNIWIATRAEGLYFIDGRTGEMTHYSHSKDDPYSVGHNNVRQVCEDLDGNLWVSTFDGLSKFDPLSSRFYKYRYELQQTAFDMRSIISMICDSQGTLWIGSFYEGLCLYNTIYDSYRYYCPLANTEGHLSSPLITSMAEDSSGMLWIGTEGGGLNGYDRRNNTFRNFRTGDGLSSNIIKSLLVDDRKNVLWVATLYDGIDRVDLETMEVRHYGPVVEGTSDQKLENVVQMEHYGDSILLASNTGIAVLDKHTGKISRLNTGFNAEHRAQVWDIEASEDGNLWFTTSTDLYCFSPADGITRYFPFSSTGFGWVNNNMNSILEDSAGRLWFGSSGSGFFLYDRQTDSFRSFGNDGSLENGYITGIAEDVTSGLIYVSTNNGIARLDPDSGEMTSFSHYNGFPLTSINENSLFITGDGELYASSLIGMVSIRCRELQNRPHDYSVYVTGLVIDNEHISPAPHSPKATLQEDILYQDHIRLEPGHASIGFELADNDHTLPANTLIEYKLEGFDDDFIYAGFKDYVAYTNLNPGHYTFIIRGTLKNTDGTFPERRIAIKVIAPFYKTWYFLLIIIMAVTGVIVYLIQAYTTNIRLRTVLDSEKREKDYVNSVNQQKLRFFTNISHEFRTPLTLINGQLEMLLSRNDLKPAVYSSILNTYRSSRRMRRLVDEIIDIRKEDQGYFKLRVSDNDITAFCREIFLSFEEYATHKGIEFSFSAPNASLCLRFDPVQMEKVIYNLLSNAFKYTNRGDSISLAIEDRGDSISIKVSDTGRGIAAGSLPHVFERFWQEDSMDAAVQSQGSGVGLSLAKTIVEMHDGTISVESEIGKGSVFTVLLKKDPHYDSSSVIICQGTETEPHKYIPDYRREDIPESDGGGGGRSDVRMLIVEDNDDVRDMLDRIFSPIYNIITAKDGMEGIEMAKKEGPDIILSDIMMPGMSGVEMCAKLKNDIETCHIPIVLLTARNAEEHVVEGLQTGADDYITKPFSVKLLVARCNNLVTGRRRLQEKYMRHPDASVRMLSANPNDQAMLQKAVDLVLQHLDDPEFSINTFAKEMGISRTYLFTKIRGLTGQSPNEFISTIRLKQAATRLLENPDASMSDIAYSLGFSSPSYFIKCFRNLYGKTPAAYRKEMGVDK